MARSGIYKSEVIRARNNLIAQGRHPSIDAVRVELGNTGSKVTIHRYLKEIEDEDKLKTKGSVAVLSEALQSLTSKLASQLQDEADQQILLAKTAHDSALKVVQDKLETAQAETESLKAQLSISQNETAAEKSRYEELNLAFIAETQTRRVAEQRALDLQLQLESEIGHRVATEAKYADARQSLEHFRAASREQRDQEVRQHENQVQFLQHEIRDLKGSLTEAQLKSSQAFQELGRLTAELGGARRELNQLENLKGQLHSTSERLASSQSQSASLNNQLEQEKQISETLRLNLDREIAQREAVNIRNRELEAELLTMKVQLETSAQVTEQIRLQVSQIIQSASGIDGRIDKSTT